MIENPSQNSKKNNFLKYIIIVIIIIIVFLVGAGIVYWFFSIDTPEAVVQNSTTTTTRTDSKIPDENNVNKTISEIKLTEESIENAIDKVYDSVLCIEVMNGSETLIGTGTGFVYKKDDKYGYVLTNSHVVNGGRIIRGVLSNNNVVDLTLLGSDTYTDIAVLRMNITDVLQVASIGSSKNLRVGNTVFTVGAPMGLDFAGTVTKGILSGKDRLIETSSSTDSNDKYIVKVIQTDAAISPGNSGGPLVDLSGSVIGINSLKLVNTQVEGMGFALPIEDVMEHVDTLEKRETIKRPVIGVQIIDLTDKYLLQRYNITVPSGITEGVILLKVTPGYPAANSGLKENDIITEVGGEKVKTVSEFKYQLYRRKVGEEVEITYIRNSESKKLNVKLDSAS